MAANFEMYAGDSKVLQVTVLDEQGAAADITGASIRWWLAAQLAGPPTVVKSTGAGITIVNGPAGRFNVTLDPADTEALRGCYYYEAEIINASIVSTVLTGMVDIKPTLIKPVVTLRAVS